MLISDIADVNSSIGRHLTRGFDDALSWLQVEKCIWRHTVEGAFGICCPILPEIMGDRWIAIFRRSVFCQSTVYWCLRFVPCPILWTSVMAAASVDTHSSEPLLADDIEGNVDESIDPSISSKPPRQSNFTQLLSSKYVVACALFSSIGGLIFGYGTHPDVNLN